VADLKLDLELLDKLSSDLAAVVAEFKNADDFSDDVAEATGQDDLAGKVRDFASKWNDKRGKMTTEVENLQKQISGISKGFTSVDDGLAKALTTPAPSPQGGAGRDRAVAS
jgi:uncharacterized phage infection (PIP) family protein YhgE